MNVNNVHVTNISNDRTIYSLEAFTEVIYNNLNIYYQRQYLCETFSRAVFNVEFRLSSDHRTDESTVGRDRQALKCVGGQPNALICKVNNYASWSAQTVGWHVRNAKRRKPSRSRAERLAVDGSRLCD